MPKDGGQNTLPPQLYPVNEKTRTNGLKTGHVTRQKGTFKTYTGFFGKCTSKIIFSTCQEHKKKYDQPFYRNVLFVRFFVLKKFWLNFALLNNNDIILYYSLSIYFVTKTFSYCCYNARKK